MSGFESSDKAFIAVDWGTTNRRAYLIEDGNRCIDDFEDGRGVLAIAAGGFEAAVSEVRDRLGEHPMLLGGMIGSNRGWVEAPYVDCPAGLDTLAAAVAWPEPGRTAIVPGVAFRDGRCDVMRGEEIQILGAAADGGIPADCVVCHPGTHNKWVEVRDSRIHAFRTVMTGEMFSLLKDHSILSPLLQGEMRTDAAFEEGVAKGLAGAGLTAELFEARASALLGGRSDGDCSAFVSGLLIGEDVRIGTKEFAPSRVVVMGRPELTQLYAAALDVAGLANAQFDGDRAFIAGARRVAERLQ